MEFVRVTNHRPTILHLPDVLVLNDAPDGRQQVGGIGNGKSLAPGGNNVDAATWELVKKNQTVQQWLKLKWMSEGGDPTEPEGPAAPETLLEFGVTTSVALAEGEDSVSVLQRWLKSDERPDVTKAIRRRLEALGAARGPGRPRKGE